MKYEDALELVGSFGRYQALMLFLSYLYATTMSFNNFSIVFLGAKPDHWCHVPALSNSNLSMDQVKELTIPKEERDGELMYSRCNVYSCTNWTDILRRQADGVVNISSECKMTPCQHGWDYDQSVYQSTIVTEWDLVCDRKPLEAMSRSVYMAGLMFGVLASGLLADWFGRKFSMFVGLALLVTFAIGVPFSNSFLTFVILRFFVAVGSIAASTSAYVLGVELVGVGPRTWAGTLNNYFWTTGALIISGLAYVIRDWRHFALSFAVPLLLLFIPFLILPESARWLYSKKKRERGENILRKVAKWNKRDVPDKLDIESDSQKQKSYPWDLFRYPRMRIRTIIIYFNWCVVSMVYYGLSLNTSALAGSDHLNFFISSVIEFPAYIFCHLTLDRLGRRRVLCFAMILGGSSLISTLAVPKEPHFEVAKTVLTMLGKWTMSVAFTTIYVFTAELFPTTMRNVGLGSSSFCARVGAVVAPQIALLGSYNKMVPSIVFGGLAVLSGLLAFVHPETSRRELPETILDAENFSRSAPVSRVVPAFDNPVATASNNRNEGAEDKPTEDSSTRM